MRAASVPPPRGRRWGRELPPQPVVGIVAAGAAGAAGAPASRGGGGDTAGGAREPRRLLRGLALLDDGAVAPLHEVAQEEAQEAEEAHLELLAVLARTLSQRVA